MNRQSGFTLVELMVTLAVAAILLTLAVPNFRDFLLNNRLTATANDFIAAANLARSEAIKRGRDATICASDTTAANPTCTGVTDWGVGWLVWVDADGDGALDADERLRVFDPVPGGMTFTANQAQFRFASSGTVNATGTITLCDDRIGETGRQLDVQLTGRININRTFGC